MSVGVQPRFSLLRFVHLTVVIYFVNFVNFYTFPWSYTLRATLSSLGVLDDHALI